MIRRPFPGLNAGRLNPVVVLVLGRFGHDRRKVHVDAHGLSQLGVATIGVFAEGYAALTVAPEGMEVTTVEYKINILAPVFMSNDAKEGAIAFAEKRAPVFS